MSRYARRRDENHSEIRDGLRAHGVVVVDTGSAGGGMPDLACLHKTKRDGDTGEGQIVLIEVKNGSRKSAMRKLTKAQIEFKRWIPVTVVVDLEQAMAACGVTAKKQEG